MAPVNGIDTYKLQANHRPVQDSQLSGSSGNQTVSHVRNAEEIKNNVLLSLVKGQTVKGEVTDLQNNSVKLLLSDGRTLSATLKNISTLSIGDAASFKVLSATNAGIALKLEGNPAGNSLTGTIIKALSAAGLQVNERNSEAVTELMRAGLPIKSSSILGILEASGNHPEASFQTLARLTQMELPVTPENISLVEAYNNHELSLQNSVTELSDRIYTAFTQTLNENPEGAGMALNAPGTSDVNMPENAAANAAGSAAGTSAADMSENAAANAARSAAGTSAADMSENAAANAAGSAAGTSAADMPENAAANAAGSENGINAALMRARLFDTVRSLGNGSAGSMPLSEFLDENRITSLNNMLAGLEGPNGVPFAVSPEMSLNNLAAMFGTENLSESAAFNAASVTPEFASAVSALLEKHWSLSPAELTEGKKRPEELARQLMLETENVNRVLRSFEEAVGKQTAGKQESSAGARNAVDFAGLVNELYPYIQIPVELRGGTVHSELFVYRKKNSGPLNKDDKISVMLHLDMEALGPLDVRVEMNRENISTRFYVNDAVSEQLINDNLPMLDKALSDKGYIFSGEVDGAKVGRNPLEDFLTGHVSGQVKRYSFDMRA